MKGPKPGFSYIGFSFVYLCIFLCSCCKIFLFCILVKLDQVVGWKHCPDVTYDELSGKLKPAML